FRVQDREERHKYSDRISIPGVHSQFSASLKSGPDIERHRKPVRARGMTTAAMPSISKRSDGLARTQEGNRITPQSLAEFGLRALRPASNSQRRCNENKKESFETPHPGRGCF